MITLNKTITSDFKSTINGLEIQGTYSYNEDVIFSIDAYIVLNEEQICRFHIYNNDGVLKINRVGVNFEYMSDCDSAIISCFNEISNMVKE